MIFSSGTANLLSLCVCVCVCVGVCQTFSHRVVVCVYASLRHCMISYDIDSVYVCHINCHRVYNNLLEAQEAAPAPPLNSATSRRARTIIKSFLDGCLPLSQQTRPCMPVKRREGCPPHSTIDTIPIDIRDYVTYLCYTLYTHRVQYLRLYRHTSPHIIISLAKLS